MTLNALDGMLARECNQKTRLGAILNETGDVISDIALYLPFLFLPESNASLVILMLFCTILTEFCGLLAQTINGIRGYVGPFGKSDRALIFGLWGWPLPFIHNGCNGIIFYGALLQFCFSGLRLIVVEVCS